VGSHTVRSHPSRFTPQAPTRVRPSSCRFHHPDGSPLRSVGSTENLEAFDPAREWILLPGNIGPCCRSNIFDQAGGLNGRGEHSVRAATSVSNCETRAPYQRRGAHGVLALQSSRLLQHAFRSPEHR